MTRHDDFTLPIERIASHGSAKTAGWTGLPPGVSMKDAVREVLDMIERSGYKIIGNEKTREGMFTLAKKPGKPSGFFVTLFEGNSRTGVAYKDLHEDMGPYAVGPSLRLLMKADPPVNEYAKEWREKALAHAGMRAQKFNPGDLVTVYGEPYVVEGPARQRGQYLIREEQTGKVYRAKPVTMQRRASRGQGKTALGQATVEAFLAVASSKLTQYDAKLQAKQPNMYRLGHYLEALNKVRADVRSFLKRDDPEALDALRKALLTRFTSSGGKASLPPINAVLRQISDYLDSGKMPSLTRRASDKTAGDHPLDRDAIVYFGIATEDYNIEEDADNGDEFAQSLMNDGGRGLNKLEGDALRNLSRMFKTRIMNEGHDGSGELVCKLPVDSWEDIKKIDAVLSRHHIGGDDEIDTGVQYVVARDFRLYPDGISGRVFYGEAPGAEGTWDDWLSEHKDMGRRASRGQDKTAKHPLDGVRGHQLLPSGVARKIPAIYSQENEDDPIAWVKFFSPYTNATWYITEYDPSSGEAFGWADLGMGGGELGYISIRELEGLQKRGLPLVERDLYWKPRKLSQAKRS